MRTERWEIDSSHSSVHFSVRHLVIAKVRGTFARWTGTVQAPADLPSLLSRMTTPCSISQNPISSS